MCARLLEMLDRATKYKPVTRNDIITTFGISDRHARHMIEDLREKGHRVCGSSDNYGYWLAKSDNEYLAFRREYVSKATTIMRRAGKMDASTLGQLEMEIQ